MAVVCKGLMKTQDYSNSFVFEIDTDIGPVFMSFNETTCMNLRSVSIVNSAGFIALWRASPYSAHKEIAHGNAKTWRKDYKFQYAEEGFSHGITNPVPLAQVNYESTGGVQNYWSKLTKKTQQGHLSFTNGITRTIWLLAHGAKYFPVEVSPGKHKELSLASGCHDNMVLDIHDMFSTSTNKRVT